MKTVSVLSFAALMLAVIYGCTQPQAGDHARAYENGTYRGVFIDGDSIQINVELRIEEDIVKAAAFRHLRRDENYHLDTKEEPYISVVQQYQEALDHLVGKNINANLSDLYNPENIVSTHVDGYTAATLRSNKIISAVRDALNRGVYSY